MPVSIMLFSPTAPAFVGRFVLGTVELTGMVLPCTLTGVGNAARVWAILHNPRPNGAYGAWIPLVGLRRR